MSEQAVNKKSVFTPIVPFPPLYLLAMFFGIASDAGSGFTGPNLTKNVLEALASGYCSHQYHSSLRSIIQVLAMGRRWPIITTINTRYGAALY
jgi:hypothetical protein